MHVDPCRRLVLRSPRLVAAILVASGCLPTPAQGQTRFVEVEPIPLGNYVTVHGVSGDGGTVVGMVTQLGSIRAYRWSELGGMVALAVPDGRVAAMATAANLDGSIIVGVGFGSVPQTQNQAVRWNADGSCSALGPIEPDAWTEVFGVSADGSIAVGQGFNAGVVSSVRWNAAGAGLALGPLEGGGHSYACGVSADGSVVVGYAQDGPSLVRAFRWTQVGGVQGVPLAQGWHNAYALAVSADGQVIVGYGARPAVGGYRAFRWSDGTGMQDLGALPCDVHSYANAVNADGSVIVGISGSRAVVWTEASGMVDLADVLASKGVDARDWQLSNAVGISHDGGTIVGDGLHVGVGWRGWVISQIGVLPCSQADIATEGSSDPASGPDGFVTGVDFDAFVQAFFQSIRNAGGRLVADITDGVGVCGPDGFLTGSDFDAFVLKFFEGC